MALAVIDRHPPAAAPPASRPAVTVLLARYLDRQTLGASRTAGLVLACIGLFLLAG